MWYQLCWRQWRFTSRMYLWTLSQWLNFIRFKMFLFWKWKWWWHCVIRTYLWSWFHFRRTCLCGKLFSKPWLTLRHLYLRSRIMRLMRSWIFLEKRCLRIWLRWRFLWIQNRLDLLWMRLSLGRKIIHPWFMVLL